METWGTGSLENDTAIDWLQDFAEEPTLVKIQSALRIGIESGHADAFDCEEAIAASEVLALIKNKKSPDFPEEEAALILKATLLLPEMLVTEAKTVLQHISIHSELLEQWEEEGRTEEWKSQINDLIARLN